jgi:coenzyme F420-dependent glucose-6-phosphate dehydrogenase
LRGTLSQELPLPSHFEEAAQMVTEEDVAGAVVCGPDAEDHLAGIERFAEAGFDRVYVHQVGPDQAGFIDFYARDVVSGARGLAPSRRGRAIA